MFFDSGKCRVSCVDTGSQEMETVFTVLFDGFEDEGLAQNGRNGGGIERLRQVRFSVLTLLINTSPYSLP